MKRIKKIISFIIKPVSFLFLIIGFSSCETHLFDSDRRQIIAKDEIYVKLRKATAYDITGFREDTVKNIDNVNFTKQIRYTLNFVYIDSNKVLQKKIGIVMFAPDGASMVSSQIIDP